MSTAKEGTLLARTRELLQSTQQSYLAIYQATNLNPNWLSALVSKRMTNPSVNKVQALYEYLSGNKLV